MLLLTILILIILMVYLLKKNITVASLLKNNTKEQFLISVKDRQKVGTVDNDTSGKQPKSTWKSGGYNYESCYSTETRNGNTTGRHGRYYCDNGVDAGEVIPSEGLYSIDLTNYTVHPGKGIRGTPLTGIHTFNGKTYTLNNDGTVNGEWALTLAQSKSFCDSLRDKCRGFNMIIPTKGSWWVPRTIFYAKLDEGWEDPDTFAKMLDVNTINTSLICYIKKDVKAVEKSIPQDKLNAASAKYKNLVTCNWKSSNRCIFNDYTYDQSSDNCVAKDGNPSYSVHELKSYSQPTITSWLDTLYKRDSGVNKLASEAVNVNEYIQRCKEVDGYEFLAGVSLPNPYIPTTKPGDVKGRYVRLTINNVNDNWLNFAELQVINNNRNIAVGKPASASSTYYGTPPSRGNDGNSLGEWSNNSVAHNDNKGGPEYWEVDLGDASRTIDRIIISNRTDCCGGRLNNWLLSIYDYNKNLIWARIYREAPNPSVSIDILNANNDMNNIRVKDYSQSRFNTYFHRVSDTEYNSKRGWDGKGCYDTCHKEICEGERKKWIGNSNWYGCREYKSGEYEADLAAAAAAAALANSVLFSIDNPSIPTLSLNNFPKLGNMSTWEMNINFNVTGYGQNSNWRPIIGDMYNNYNNRGWGVWISPDNNIHFSWQSVTWNANPQFNVQLNTNYNLKISMTLTSLTLLLTNLNNNTTQTAVINSTVAYPFVNYVMTTNGPVTIGGWINYSGERFPGRISSIKVRDPSNIGNSCPMLENGIPDFNCKFGNETSGTNFELGGWKLVSSVGTYGNEGLPAILSQVPPPLMKSNNYPRMAGFLQSIVIIGIIGPKPRILKGFDWYGCANYGSNRNAKSIMVFGSNKDYTFDRDGLQAVSRGTHLYSNTRMPRDITTQNPFRVNINNNTAFRAYYFVIAENYGDSSVKVGSINLRF
jgi:hypothetical protein